MAYRKNNGLELDNTPVVEQKPQQDVQESTVQPTAQQATSQPQHAGLNTAGQEAQAVVDNAQSNATYLARQAAAALNNQQQQAPKPAPQVAAPAPSQAITSLLDQVNAYVTEYGTMPSDEEIANMTAGKRWRLIKAMKGRKG